MVPRIYFQSSIKIGSVISEIFLIWTYVPRTNVAWRNVAMTVEISSSFVRIGSVTAEIFLIWTIVARTNVAWSNVTAIVEICSR